MKISEVREEQTAMNLIKILLVRTRKGKLSKDSLELILLKLNLTIYK